AASGRRCRIRPPPTEFSMSQLSRALPPALLAVVLPAIALAACEGPGSGLPGPAQAPDGQVAIGAVQGSGDASPMLDRRVAIEGVVTGSFGRHLGGWFVQDAGDGDPATSDALFVVSDADPGLRAGDRVRVHGRVVEHGERGRGTLT